MDTPTRRDFVRLTACAAGGLSLAGCGDDQTGTGVAPDPEATPQRDRAILNGALTLENTAVAAYGVGLEVLRGEARRRARELREQEHEHKAALAAAVRELGGEPNRPKPAAEYRAAFPRLRDQADALRFLTDLENVAISAYVEGVPKLSDPRLRQTVAAILANEAQHVSLLLRARHPRRPEAAVPEAFVSGRALG